MPWPSIAVRYPCNDNLNRAAEIFFYISGRNAHATEKRYFDGSGSGESQCRPFLIKATSEEDSNGTNVPVHMARRDQIELWEWAKSPIF